MVCAALVDRKTGEQAHGLIVNLGLETEVSVGTPYVKRGDVDPRLAEPNDVCWSAMHAYRVGI